MIDVTTNELPDDLRAPLHSLQADLDCLIARIRQEGDEVATMMRDSIRNRLSQIEEASYRLANPPRLYLPGTALEHLKHNQRQLDEDGCEVGVSRQALDELISAYEAICEHLALSTKAEYSNAMRMRAAVVAARSRSRPMAEPARSIEALAVERPLIFSGPMVRAILDGRKTMTRRVLKPQPPDGFAFLGIYAPHLTAVFEAQGKPDHAVRLPYAPGDRLWVREGLGWNRDGDNRFFYRADDADVPPGIIPAGYRISSPHEPAMLMPRWASRVTLEVLGIKVERLQEISEADAEAEGADRGTTVGWSDETRSPCRMPESWRDAFRHLWNGIHGAGSWEQNPWVVAVSFRRLEPLIMEDDDV